MVGPLYRCFFNEAAGVLANDHLACYVPPQRYPILMYLGSRFENGRLCGARVKANGPNLNGQRLLSHKYQSGGSRRGGDSLGGGRAAFARTVRDVFERMIVPS